MAEETTVEYKDPDVQAHVEATGELPIDAVEPKAEDPRDRVVMSSRHADGEPSERALEFIGDPEQVVAAAKTQLAQQAVTRIDEGINRQRRVEPAAVRNRVTNPAVARIADAQDKEIAKAEKQAEADVKKHHPDA